jgi:hypothetical protein
MIARHRLAAACIVTGTLALPAAASAMPTDIGRPAPPKTTAPPPPRTIVESVDNTLPLAVAGAALLVAMSSAGHSALRLAPLRAARGERAPDTTGVDPVTS